MTPDPQWRDLGPVEQFTRRPLTAARVGTTRLVITHVNGEFGALSGTCNHAGGPLAEGRIDGEYVLCPWHNWKYHWRTGLGEPGFEADAVPRYDVRVSDGRLQVSAEPVTRRTHAHHPPHAVARKVQRAPGPVRVLGISTTNMDVANPRYSTSDALLAVAMDHAASLGKETRTIRLAALRFRPCEGYYSKSAHACTWPCSITQMDPQDQMEQVYEGIVHWGDVVLVATPIRWGNASSLYYRMVERMNCVQNQVTIANRVLLRNKVAAFIITGGQDNVQAVAGQMLGFFAEIGCHFPQFPYIAHSRGWSAEDMERNNAEIQNSGELREGAQALVTRAADMARLMVEGQLARHPLTRGGRKAHQLDSEPTG
ncbi:MAG: NAD(P)H-dependent oxidoreductase [Gemmatimonadaceae bacterium]|nr:NAD(P)H-dependent oxidoreductase [Gemmatimonadaceae bacterium]